MRRTGLALLYVGLPLVLAEVTEVAPWLAARLLASAVRLLPSGHRERYLREWLGELDAVPGNLLKFLFAVRITLRAPATRRELEHAEPAWLRLGRWLLTAVITCAFTIIRLAAHALGRLPNRTSMPGRVHPNDLIWESSNLLPLADGNRRLAAVRRMMWVSTESTSLDTPIEELDLSVGTYNSLKRAGITTVGDFVGMTDPTRQLLRIRNFGRASLEELQEKLGEVGWDHESWQ